ncbi:MAG: type II secretion system protein [Chthoniobacterales bacterium]
MVELLVVMAIILVLAGLVLATSSYVHNKGARSRAEAEIAAMSAALENYKADNGVYPRDYIDPANPPSPVPKGYVSPYNFTDNLNAKASGNPTNYESSSRFVYGMLSGDKNFDGKVNDQDKQNPSDATEPIPTTYYVFKLNALSVTKDSNGNVTAVNYVKDPFGNSYGYSTAGQLGGTTGYNPTFDHWSTCGNSDTNNPPNQSQWIKNW